MAEPNEISGDEFDRAVRRSARTMQELADLIGVSRSMIHAYRRDGVTRGRTVDKVRQVMALWLREDTAGAFDGYTDEDLLAELGRRLAERHRKA